MRSRPWFSCGPLWVALLLFGSGVHQPGRAQAQEVERFIQVLDASGAPVTDLGPADFIVEHAGVERTVIRAELINEPLRVALLVDNADGARGYFRNLRDGLPAFVNALPDDSEIALILLSGQPRVVVDYTEARATLMEGLGSFFVYDGRAAAFFPGLIETVARFDAEVRWPVLAVVTTDGASQGRPTVGAFDAFLDEVRDRGVTVHALGLFTTRGDYSQTGIASNVTSVSGGWYDTLAGPTQAVSTKLTEMAAEISRRHVEMQDQYAVVYELPPGADPTVPITAAVRRQEVTLRISTDGRPRPTILRVADGATVGEGREELFNAGEAAFASGDVDQAADYYEKAHAADASWGKPLFKLALVALNKGETDAAVQYLEQVVEVDPSSEDGTQAQAILAQLKP